MAPQGLPDRPSPRFIASKPPARPERAELGAGGRTLVLRQVAQAETAAAAQRRCLVEDQHSSAAARAGEPGPQTVAPLESPGGPPQGDLLAFHKDSRLGR